MLGLPPDVEERDELPTTTAALDELLVAAARQAGEPSLGLRLAVELPERRMGPLELAARTSSTVRDALLAVVRFAPLLHPGLTLALDEDVPGEARLHGGVAGRPRGIGRHLEDFILARALAGITGIGPHVPVIRVWFPHARPADLAPIERLFGTRDLDFGREELGFAFLATTLSLSIASSDARLHATAIDLAEAALATHAVGGTARDFVAVVAARVRAAFDPGNGGATPTIDTIADALHMSARTLQRRLEDSGTHFSGVLDLVREGLARELVAKVVGGSMVPLAEIAWRLGFSDVAAFSRAFKRWTGLPPGMMRRRS
jgi:AraC-like DNA-binding protein